MSLLFWINVSNNYEYIYGMYAFDKISYKIAAHKISNVILFEAVRCHHCFVLTLQVFVLNNNKCLYSMYAFDK